MKKTVRICINLSSVLNRICAESAWHAAHNPDVMILTDDQLPLVCQHLEEGMADLKSALGGYITLFSFNPNVDERSIQIELTFVHSVPYRVDIQMHDTVINLLTNFVLMRSYVDDGNYFDTAWRRSRAQLLLILARDQLAMKHPL